MSAYDDHVLSRNPLFYMRGDRLGTPHGLPTYVVPDDSGNGNVLAGYEYATAGEVPIDTDQQLVVGIDGSFRFMAADQPAVFDNGPLDMFAPGQVLTVEQWVRRDRTDQLGMLFGGHSNPHSAQSATYLATGGQFGIPVRTIRFGPRGNIGTLVDWNDSIPPGPNGDGTDITYLVHLLYDTPNRVAELRINGESVGKKLLGADDDWGANFRNFFFGIWHAASTALFSWDGWMAGLAVYDRLLTGAETRDTYRVGTGQPIGTQITVPRSITPPRRRLSWALCDIYGRKLAQITDRRQGRVGVSLNGQRYARCTITAEDEAARVVYPLAARIKVWLDEKPLFNGPITTPKLTTGESDYGQGALEIAAVCPSAQLMAAFVDSSYSPAKEATFSQERQSTIMWELVALADFYSENEWDPATAQGGTFQTYHARGPYPSHGIIQGSLAADLRRDRSYPDGKQIWEALVQMSEVIGGPDFELEPLDTETGEHARFNTFYPQQGSFKDDVVLEYGTGRHNASDFSWEPDGSQVVNHMTIVGQATKGTRAPAYVAYQEESMALFGVWQGYEARSDVSRVQTLKEHATAIVEAGAFPIDFYDVTPAVEAGGVAQGWRRGPSGDRERVPEQSFSVPPAFGPGDDFDYWLGDSFLTIARVGAIGEEPGVELALRGRITDAEFQEIDDDGNLLVDLTCAPHTPAALVQGYSTYRSVADSF